MSQDTTCENLIISYFLPPHQDVSGIIQAKKILTDKKRVDVVVCDCIGGSSSDFDDLLSEYVNEKIFIEMNNKPTDYPKSIMQFIKKGMEEIEKRNNDYKKISSICWRLSNHFLALEYKLKYPNVFWAAEFSDPILYNVFNIKRELNLNDEDYVNRINEKISQLGDYPLIENPVNIHFLVEYLAYLFADEIIFTNENQRELMLSYSPIEVHDLVMEKSQIIAAPTLDDKYYHIRDVQVDIDENMINLAYFGTYYPNRHFESLFYALDSLNHKFKDKIKFHMYVTDPEFLKGLIEDSGIEDNFVIKESENYFDFLNLTTKFDILIVNDILAKDNFKINPYLPSKINDYDGSGTDVWAICEKGSILSNYDVKYKSDVRQYETSRDVLVKILEDYGYADENLSFDEDYFDKRLTLFNVIYASKYKEISKLNQKIKKLESKNRKLKKLEKENKKLKKTTNEILSSKSWKITEPLRKLKNRF